MLPTRHVFLGAVFCSIALVTLAIAMPQRSPADMRDRDRAAIAQTVASFQDAWNQHDAHAFAMTFTKDADVTNVLGVHVAGRGNVEAFMAPLFAGVFKDSHETQTIRSIRFLAAGLAAVDVDWKMTGVKLPDSPSPALRKGLMNSIMAKQSNGTWLIEVFHNTELTDLPPAQPSK